MAAEFFDFVRRIAEERGVYESEVFERALERGLDKLWEGLVLGQYLDGELDNKEAIERVDQAKVKRTERELVIVQADVE